MDEAEADATAHDGWAWEAVSHIAKPFLVGGSRKTAGNKTDVLSEENLRRFPGSSPSAEKVLLFENDGARGL